MMLMVMKVSATGMPMKSSTMEPPSISQAAIAQPLTEPIPAVPPSRCALPPKAGSCRADRFLARGAVALVQADQAEAHLDGEQDEDGGQEGKGPPFRRHQGTDVDGAGRIARPGRLGTVPGDRHAAGEADHVGQQLEVPGGPR